MSAVTLWGAPYRGLGRTIWTGVDPYARDPWTPFDALVRRAFPTDGEGFTPAADVVRDGDDAVVRLELPGVDVAKDVTVEVDHDRLVVRGERRDEHTERQEGHEGHRREVRFGSFRRTFRLPAHVDGEAVSASYDAGVLTVRVVGAHAEPEPYRVPVTGADSGVGSGAPAEGHQA